MHRIISSHCTEVRLGLSELNASYNLKSSLHEGSALYESSQVIARRVGSGSLNSMHQTLSHCTEDRLGLYKLNMHHIITTDHCTLERREISELVASTISSHHCAKDRPEMHHIISSHQQTKGRRGLSELDASNISRHCKEDRRGLSELDASNISNHHCTKDWLGLYELDASVISIYHCT